VGAPSLRKKKFVISYSFSCVDDPLVLCVVAAELCKKLRQEQAEMRDDAERLNSEIRSLEADVR